MSRPSTANTNRTNRKSPSLILAEKPVEDILAPKPLAFSAAGQDFEIYPMPNRVLLVVGGAMSQVTGVIEALADLMAQAQEAQTPLTPADYLSITPQVLQALLPCATTIIAGCLRQPEQWVEDNLRLHQKLEALRLILEAEDLPLIVKNGSSLLGSFQGAFPALKAMETAEPKEINQSPT